MFKKYFQRLIEKEYIQWLIAAFGVSGVVIWIIVLIAFLAG